VQQNDTARPRARRPLLTTLAVATAGALAGAALASPQAVAQAGRWVTGAQVVDGSIASKDVKNGSLLSKDIRNGSIRWKDLAPGARRPGPAGPTGPAGPQGAIGSAGPAGAPGVSGWELVTTNAPPLNLTSNATLEAACDAGQKVIGGGVNGLTSAVGLLGSAPDPTGTGWVVKLDLTGLLGSTVTGVTVNAICVDA
jgi:hypothetical protein